MQVHWLKIDESSMMRQKIDVCVHGTVCNGKRLKFHKLDLVINLTLARRSKFVVFGILMRVT